MDVPIEKALLIFSLILYCWFTSDALEAAAEAHSDA